MCCLRIGKRVCLFGRFLFLLRCCNSLGNLLRCFGIHCILLWLGVCFFECGLIFLLVFGLGLGDFECSLILRELFLGVLRVLSFLDSLAFLELFWGLGNEDMWFALD